MAIDFNSLLNPVGSVTHDNTKGKHRGLTGRSFSYSANNPVMKQIESMLASGKYNADDVGDLYDKAYQWEIDNANWMNQLKVDQAIKEEQREYDSPVEEAQRLRQAGINPDIEGNLSGGSGGSGTSAGATAPDNQGSLGRTDNYAAKNYALSALQAAADFTASLANSTTSIIDSVGNMRMLTSRQELNKAQAGLASAQANEINQLLAGKATGQQLANQSTELGLETTKLEQSMARLQQYAQFSQLISPDTQDMAPLLTSLGVDKESIPGAIELIKQMHANPEMQAKYASDQLAARKAIKTNELLDDNIITSMIDIQKEIELNNLLFQKANSKLLSSVEAALVNDPNYVDNLISIALDDTQTNKIASSVELDNMKKDAAAWGRLWDSRMDMLKQAETNLTALKKSAMSDGNFSEVEIANYYKAWTHYMALRDCMSTEFNTMRGHFIEILQKRFESVYLIDSNGALNNMDFIGALEHFSNVNFDDAFFNLPSGAEIVRRWIDTSSGVVEAGAEVAQAVRGFSFNSTYGQAHSDTSYRKGFEAGRKHNASTR